MTEPQTPEPLWKRRYKPWTLFYAIMRVMDQPDRPALTRSQIADKLDPNRSYNRMSIRATVGHLHSQGMLERLHIGNAKTGEVESIFRVVPR